MTARALRKSSWWPTVGLIFFLLTVLGLIGALTLWQYQARRIQTVQIGSLSDASLVQGFHESERSDYLGGRTFRWSMPSGSSLRFWSSPSSDATLLSLWMSVSDPVHAQVLTLSVADAPIATLAVGPVMRRYVLMVPVRSSGDLVIHLRSPRYPVHDTRDLGAVLWQAQLAEVARLPLLGLLGEFAAFPQLPLTLLLLALAFGRPGRRLLVSGAIALMSLALVSLSWFMMLSPLLLATCAWHLTITLLVSWLIVQLAQRLPNLLPTTDRRAQIWLALGFVALVLLTFSPSIYSDGKGYFAYLRSMIIDHDLSFINEYQVLWGNNPWHGLTATGLAPNPWSIGPALIWMPLYSLTHALLQVIPTPWPTDGFSAPYVLAVTLTTAISTLLLQVITYRICRRWVLPGPAVMATYTLVLGSTLLYYSMRSGSFAHALSATTTALFVLAWIRLEEEESLVRWLAMGAATGLLLLVYWACAVMLILPLMTLLRHAGLAWRAGGWRQLWVRIQWVAVAGLATILV
ncbi:MAG: hypothetical protein HGA19_23145, partial [Oscillochloris sp.]|nr:hypothetical protein [Oscillochloris sp.]